MAKRSVRRERHIRDAAPRGLAVARVSAMCTIRGAAGIAIVPGVGYDLDATVAPGVRLRDLVRLEWFDLRPPARSADDEE